MLKIFKIILLTFLGIVGLIILSLIIAYFSLSGDNNPARTVAQDKNLPQVTLNGINFHSQTFGSDTNKTIIVLHSGPGNDYKNLLHLKNLSDKYFVVFYDQRGCGLSQRVSPELLNYENYLLDLKGFVDKYSNKRKVILIGQSWGANLALYFTAKYPEMVESLILSSPSALNNDLLEIMMDKIDENKAPSFSNILHLIGSWLKSLHVSGPDEQASKDFFMREFIFNADDDSSPLRKYFGDTFPQSEKDLWRFGADASQNVIKSMLNSDGLFKVDFMKNYDKFEGKTYVFTGAKDKITGKDFQQKQSEFYNFEEIIEIENCGHNFFSEKPELALIKIKEILYVE